MLQSMTVEAFRGYLKGSAPTGTFWRGPAFDRFIDALTNAYKPTVELICSIPTTATPFATPHRDILLQYLEYLDRVGCVPIPVDIEELRQRVLDLYAADSVAFLAGWQLAVVAYLPLVVPRDDDAASLVPVDVYGPVDGATHAVTAWYSELETSNPVEHVECVMRALAPATSTIRLVTPELTFSNPTDGQLVGNLGIWWQEMIAESTFKVELYDAGMVLVEVETVIIEPSGFATPDDFLSVAPGDNVSGYRLDITGLTNWAGAERTTLIRSYTWP